MIKSFCMDRYNRYGILGVCAVSAVFLKILLFYAMIGNISNIIPVVIVTCGFTYLLFASLKNKWIPAIIFALFSVLMVCDVTYAGFFNRYLSFGMLGSAEVIGNITESIKEVFNPLSLLLLADTGFIFACIKRNKRRALALAKEEEEKKVVMLGGIPDLEVTPTLVKRAKKNKRTFKKWVLAYKNGLIAGLVLLILMTNITNSNMIKSISNQEIYTYHLKDAVTNLLGISGKAGMAAFTDSYRDEMGGPLFGAAKGRNLIVIQLESFQNFVVGRTYNGQEITPNLNRLIEEENTAYFDHYYQQVGTGNTSDAEFATNNSIYGTLTSYTYKLYGSKNYFRGLPVLLREQGYDTAVFHAYEGRNFWSRETAYPNMGFNRFYGGLTNREEGAGDYEMKEWMGWGLTDTYFYEQTGDFMKELKQPFYSFVISLSNHHPYEMLDHYQFIELLPEDRNTMVGNYLNSAAYTDYALGQFLQQLKDDEIYENSVIALYGDHVGLSHSDASLTKEIDTSMERILGKPYDFDTMMNVPLIISLPNSAVNINKTISTAGGQVDFMPTIAYLMGFQDLETIYLGHNLFTIKEGFVAEQTYMTKGSFFTNEIAYEMSRDGVFENGRAWNVNTGQPVPLEQCHDGYMRSMDIINTSEYILRSDAIRKMYLDGESVSAAFNMKIAKDYPEDIAIAGVPDMDRVDQNSPEAMDYSYAQGHRTIRVDIDWTKDSEPVAYDKNTGKVSMTYQELISWMENHADTKIVVNIERSGDYFMRFILEKSPAIQERIILELRELTEYTGRHDAIINISGVPQTAEEIAPYLTLNNVWAVMMNREDAEGRFSDFLTGETAVYVIDEETGMITKEN